MWQGSRHARHAAVAAAPQQAQAACRSGRGAAAGRARFMRSRQRPGFAHALPTHCPRPAGQPTLPALHLEGLRPAAAPHPVSRARGLACGAADRAWLEGQGRPAVGQAARLHRRLLDVAGCWHADLVWCPTMYSPALQHDGALGRGASTHRGRRQQLDAPALLRCHRRRVRLQPSWRCCAEPMPVQHACQQQATLCRARPLGPCTHAERLLTLTASCPAVPAVPAVLQVHLGARHPGHQKPAAPAVGSCDAAAAPGEGTHAQLRAASAASWVGRQCPPWEERETACCAVPCTLHAPCAQPAGPIA